MSSGERKGDLAISAGVSTILMVVLVLGIAMVIWSVWMGWPSILHDKVYIAGEAKAVEVIQPGGIPMQVVGYTIRRRNRSTLSARPLPSQEKRCCSR